MTTHHLITDHYPAFTPGVHMVTLRITKGSRVRERHFQDIEEAAKFGVAYYLTDNAYASRSKAKTAADRLRSTGSAECEGYRFEVLS